MKQLIVKDKRRRKKFLNSEVRKKCFKFMTHTLKLTEEKRWFFDKLLGSAAKSGSVIRIANRCVVTGRVKSVYSKYKLSRIMLRDLISNKQIAGMQKSSW
jgi:small subunit ribosomal protein S14